MKREPVLMGKTYHSKKGGGSVLKGEIFSLEQNIGQIQIKRRVLRPLLLNHPVLRDWRERKKEDEVQELG